MKKQNVRIAYIGIGSNLGNREENLSTALNRIGEFAGCIEAASSLYETEPWGFQTDKKFLNMVVKIETFLDPKTLLQSLLKIEKTMGRERNSIKYASRIIDLDILFYSNLISEDLELTIPHPHIHERMFVLLPMNEIDQDFIHPVFNQSVNSLLKSCSDISSVVKHRFTSN
ncbi:MAG TPA: 2-amino-4-hydroxy-6-hydroxymethyldihydropteridine diphosphokinase [Bacteroidales bacterium]|nr:2-amino-4-hydroxy-6-hydroxymethyldihydropteridine diphosphokinase [Bacteroidales bacterium]